ncbi:oleoyl-ACP hydrolase [Streptomyces olivaceoviridis]|uniref:thioesterase II family protein n=1 Tax=Streptomyces olivaceoviridis TaxID=1921 RepID=UPI001674824D|nr:thioesterase II family protein [Streptomyces olivaceoviridis]GGZ29553.1 oleoyl-ACP hydrolase [Streptomyces olivaceoviridis]
MSPRESSLASSWIRRYVPAPEAPVRLVCLPHAGGSATFYGGLARRLAPDIDVLAVQYPGRLERRTEPPMTDLTALAEVLVTELTPWTDRTYVLFGHSLGAMVAFETARRLEAAGRPPVALFVSGRGAPSRHRREFGPRLDDATLLQQMRGLGGTDPRVFADEELMWLALPVMRADYRMVEDYRYLPGPPLSCPVTAFNGRTDPKVSSPDVDAWRDHTTASFESLVFPGGHFYLVDRSEEVTAALIDRLSHITRRNTTTRQ